MLRSTLDAVGRSTRTPDRLLVVDSASVSPVVGEVARDAGADLVRCEIPGLGRARNAGLAHVREDLVAFTDDDCLPEPQWLERIVQAFSDLSEPGFITGQVRADVLPTGRATLTLGLTDEVESRVLGTGDDPRLFGHGANMAWRRRDLERIGGFDEAMGVGSILRAGEDVDAWWRATAAGVTGLYVPNVLVFHRQWRSRRAALRSYYGYGVGLGAVTLKRARVTDGHSGAQATSTLVRRLLLEGLGPVWGSMRRGYQMAVVADSLMLVGGIRGALLARKLPVVNGHFEHVPA